jgi:hypothetical protein
MEVGGRKWCEDAVVRIWIARREDEGGWRAVRRLTKRGSLIVATEPVMARRRCFLESSFAAAVNGVVGRVVGPWLESMVVVMSGGWLG